ncbi:MAG TPA: branched-chain amino acid transaminase [Thermoanaerobaculia bacterium]|nr:branched-chain amino acid transaminase [Thermoanaerobaculia bacterium]
MAPPNPFASVRWIWKNGELVEFEKATVHVLSHALHYGSGVFEGIRCYKTRQGPAILRLPEHLQRLALSAKVYRMELPFSLAEIGAAISETISANGFDSCYIRPLIFRGLGTMGVNPLRSPVEVVIATYPWGRYLGEDAQNAGVDACVSSWRRPSSSTLPSMAKATGNYLNSQLIKMEAVQNGYAEGIALDAGGYVSEGSGENIFLVAGGTLLTPPLSASLLPGITRDAVITLAREMGYSVLEQVVPRGLLYTCDELFFTGTAAEITPVRSVDRQPVGAGVPGEVTRRLLAEFNGLVSGEIRDRHGWLTPLTPVTAAGSRKAPRRVESAPTLVEAAAAAGPGAPD